MTLQRFLHKPQRGLLVSGLGDIALQDLALLVDRPPQVMQLSVDLYVDLIEMPLPLPETAHPACPLTSHISRKQWTKSVPPVPHSLMADVDPALRQQILDVPKAQRKTYIHHYDQTDDLW